MRYSLFGMLKKQRPGLGAIRRGLVALCVSQAACFPALAEDTNLYWGDTHLHTENSNDAYENGNVNADLDTAYRFASGLPVIHPATGTKIRIERPLDFLVVADHAELLQLLPRLRDRDPDVVETPAGRRLLEIFKEDPSLVFNEIIAISLRGANQDVLDQLHTPGVRQSAWDKQIAAAERYNKPNEFTAFIGWEWSSTPNSLNLHRVVFTPDGADVAKQFLPYSSYDSIEPEDLWKWLDETSARTGARFVAIPHNSNLSNGLMFPQAGRDGQPLTLDYVRSRSRWEPVVEVTQMKGTSETHPALSRTDEFADFEIRNILFDGRTATPKEGSYARSGLLRGLKIEDRLGVNPYKFGMIGSTDAHTGLAGAREDRFYGKTGRDIRPEDRALQEGQFPAWAVSASGLAAVWATENSRDAIFEAFKRKEVYATTGSRIRLRVFGGFDFGPPDAEAPDTAATGYSKGLPMGGNLTKAPNGKAPSFLIHAAKDPDGANLDRVQVVKGWVTEDGQMHQKIYNVAWSDDRRRDASGKLQPVGNTVDPATAEYENSIGAGELVTVWSDPDFEQDLRAFYYVRVLEIPTPRHQVYDAVALGIDAESFDYPVSIQERAYSSPIWYTP